MTRMTLMILSVCGLLAFAGLASASLIGDSVVVQFNNFPSPQTVTVVTPGIELPGASTATFGAGGTVPRWDINIESTYITIDIIAGPASYGLGSRFTFSDLDWVGSGGPGAVVGAIASSNQTIIPVSATFTADSVRVEFGSDTDNWQIGDQIRVDLQTIHVPEPASAALLGIIGLGALIRGRRVQS